MNSSRKYKVAGALLLMAVCLCTRPVRPYVTMEPVQIESDTTVEKQHEHSQDKDF